MASTQSRRRSDRHRGKAMDERDMIDSQARSSHRISYHSDRPQRTLQPQVLSITVKSSNVFIGVGSDEQSQARSSPVPRPNSRVAQLKKENDRYTSEDSDSESSIYSSVDESHTSSRSIRTVPSSQSSPAHQCRVFLRDEGYGTGASRDEGGRSSKKRGKARVIKSDHNSDLSRRSSNASLPAEINRPRRTPKKPKPQVESDNEDSETSVGDTHLAEEGDDNKRDSESDDDLGFEIILVSDHENKQVEVQAILDTGTKPDWVSDHFLKRLGLKEEKLAEDNNREFTDFNGKGFKATGKVDLLVMNENFTDAPVRRISFLVTKKGKFDILFGRKTIFKEKIISRPPKDLAGGEGAYTGYQKGPKKEEKEHIARRKAEQADKGAKEDKKRVEEKKAKKQEEQTRTMANFAAESKPARAKERNRSILPSRPSTSRANRDSKSSPLAKLSRVQIAEKSSSSSLDDLEDGGALL